MMHAVRHRAVVAAPLIVLAATLLLAPGATVAQEVGLPLGTIAPPVAALLAASGPAMPSGVPVPNSFLCFDQRLASL